MKKWVAHEVVQNGFGVIRNENGVQVAHFRSWQEAALAAEAPEMLEQLKAARDCLASQSFEVPGWDVLALLEKIDAVIAKAEPK